MSDSTFIDLHEQMNTKGWIPDWEFNEAVDLYKYNNYKTIAECEGYKTDLDANGAWIYHLGSLTNGYRMFYNTTIASFSGDLSSLTDGSSMFWSCESLTSFNGDLSNLSGGTYMFDKTALESFNGDLSSLTSGSCMFHNSALASFSGDLSKLIYGWNMFRSNPLESFDSNLPSLTDGTWMFHNTNLTSFDSDLSSLIHGQYMFYKTPLESFNSDLSSLTNGTYMFHTTALESFNRDLSNLENGYAMFYNAALQSFNGDLSRMTDGRYMFYNTHVRTYDISHYKMVDGVKQEVTTSVTATGLKSFTSKLSSLTSGYMMFGNSSNASPLDEKSIMIIADTINDIRGLGLTGDNGQCQLWLGYDTSITDTTNIMNCCDRIADKGWVVYLNGSQYTSTDSGSAALIDDESSTTHIPYYYKPLQVTDQKIAEYVDGNGNLFIIVGGQHVFGDDISSYGMFTSFEHAISEISISLGLTPYEKPDDEIIEES